MYHALLYLSLFRYSALLHASGFGQRSLPHQTSLFQACMRSVRLRTVESCFVAVQLGAASAQI